MKYLRSGFLLLVLMSSGTVSAEQQIEVQGLFAGKAVVVIDGERRVMSMGETSPEGVKLIAADANQATLEVDGQQKNYTLGAPVSLNFAEAASVEEKIFANNTGMFMSVGSINGQSVRFLVDTGASSVAMNTTQARSLGLRYESEGQAATVSTASGFAKAYRVQLKTVSLGKIRRRNIEAMVIDGEHPGPILLGMSFLGDLRVEKSGKTMTLKSR